MERAVIGKWAFIAGLVIAAIAGLIFPAPWLVWVLAILGVIVGLLNVTAEEAEKFLLAAIAFALSIAALASVPLLGEAITSVLAFLGAFVAGAMVVVALRVLFLTTRS
jgi:hypothetical protein